MRLSTVLKIVAVAVLATVVGLIAAAKSLDSKRYQTFLAEQVKAATGLVLTFSGPTKLKLGLSPQVSFTGMTLAGRAGAPPLLYIDRIEAQVALLPLVFRELRMERVALFRPVLRLDALPRPTGVFDLATPAEKVPVTRLALADIRIEDAAIVWRAAASDTRITLASARIQPETVDGGPLTLQAVGSWNGTGFELGGTVGSARALISGKPYPLQLKGTIDGTVVVARGTVAEPLAAKGLDIDLKAQGDELADPLRRAAVALGGKPVAAAGPYKLSAKLTDSQGAIGLSDIDAVLGKRDSLLLGLKGAVKSLAPIGGVELAITAEADSLAGLSRLIAVDLPTAGPLKLSARLQDTEGGWRLTGIKSILGRSDFAGELALTQSPRPRFFGRLAAATFVPTDLGFPQAKASDHSRAAAAPQRPAIPVIDGRILSLEPLPLDGLKVFDLDLSLVAAKLQVGTAALTDASAEIRLAGGKLVVDAFSAHLGEGRVTGGARLDTTARTPGFTLRLAGTGLDFARLGGDAPAVARGDLAVDLKGGGSNPRTLAGSLDGSVWISLGETVLAKGAGNNLAPRLIAALDSTTGDPARLRCAVLRLAVKGGLLSTDKGIALETQRAAVLGSGTIDLRTEATDLAFVVRGGGSARLRGMLGSPVLITDEPAAKLTPDASPCRAVAKPRR
ncbi:MAG: AsmA family protein [Magnetospirillum sp.]|nr:MAG: AsmA family protein [Magnetospirillum sp.]